MNTCPTCALDLYEDDGKKICPGCGKEYGMSEGKIPQRVWVSVDEHGFSECYSLDEIEDIYNGPGMEVRKAKRIKEIKETCAEFIPLSDHFTKLSAKDAEIERLEEEVFKLKEKIMECER